MCSATVYVAASTTTPFYYTTQSPQKPKAPGIGHKVHKGGHGPQIFTFPRLNILFKVITGYYIKHTHTHTHTHTHSGIPR